jgi:glutamate carboxypeptidase
MIHYDTVFPPGEAGRRPYRREGARGFGPGVADAKGGAAIVLHALAIAERRGIERDAEQLVDEHRLPDTQVSVAVIDRRPPFTKNAASERLAALATGIYLGLGRELGSVAARYGTDAGYAYRAGQAKPARLEGLGIVGGGLHTSEEWADASSIAPRRYLTLKLIELLGNAPD